EFGRAFAGRARALFQPLLAAVLEQAAEPRLQVEIGLPQRHRKIGSLVHVVTSGVDVECGSCLQRAQDPSPAYGCDRPWWRSQPVGALTAVDRGGAASTAS